MEEFRSDIDGLNHQCVAILRTSNVRLSGCGMNEVRELSRFTAGACAVPRRYTLAPGLEDGVLCDELLLET
jgi:hypothetical protein